MSNLVARLRKARDFFIDTNHSALTAGELNDAANRIEALEAENARLREMLKEAASIGASEKSVPLAHFPS